MPAITFSDESIGDTPPAGMADPAPGSDPSPGLCQECGLPLPPREPGARGPAKKYHEACRPSGNKASTVAKGRTSSTDRLIDQIEGKYVALGAFAKMVGFEADSKVLLEAFVNPFTQETESFTGARKLAEGWRSTLDNNPKLRKLAEKWLNTAAGGSLLFGHAIVGLTIAENHGVHVMQKVITFVMGLLMKQATPKEMQ